MIPHIKGSNVLIEAFVDSKTVLDPVFKDGTSTERWLQINISSMRESYANGSLVRIDWILACINPADASTRPVGNKASPLWSVITTNRIALQPICWASLNPPQYSHTDATHSHPPTSEEEEALENGDTNEPKYLVCQT